MKFSFNMTKKEYAKYLNIAFGSKLDFLKMKKKKQLPKTFWQISSIIYLLSILHIPLIFLFDSLIKYNWLVNILFISMIILFLINIILTTFLILIFIKQQKCLQGKFELKDKGLKITYGKEKKTLNWNEINTIGIWKNVIIIYSKKQTHLLPNNNKELKKALNAMKKTKLNIIDYSKVPKEKGFLIQFWNWGIYVFLILISFGIMLLWNFYNISLLDKEVWKINDSGYQIDEAIYAKEKFSIIEKSLKEYFASFRIAKENYEKNTAEIIFSELTIDYLKNHKEDLPKLLAELPQKSLKVEAAFQKIIELLEEEKALEYLKEENLGNYYQTIFKKYALTKDDHLYIEDWKKTFEKNKEKMEYVKQVLEILTNENACWFIENDMFYICKEEDRVKYNTLYSKILDE